MVKKYELTEDELVSVVKNILKKVGVDYFDFEVEEGDNGTLYFTENDSPEEGMVNLSMDYKKEKALEDKKQDGTISSTVWAQYCDFLEVFSQQIKKQYIRRMRENNPFMRGEVDAMMGKVLRGLNILSPLKESMD